ENGVTDRTIGIILDGTGYGTDGTIWGGEVLVGDLADFERFAWLRPFALPGGTAAIKHPWRTAYALLQASHPGNDPFRRGRPESAPRAAACPNGRHSIPSPTAIPAWLSDSLLPFKSAAEREAFDKVIRQGINTPLTSSCGRLFDGVSALLGLCDEVTYEGQAAIALEIAAEGGVAGRSPGLIPGRLTTPGSISERLSREAISVLKGREVTPGFSPGPAGPNSDPRAGFNPRGIHSNWIPDQSMPRTRSGTRDDGVFEPAGCSLDWTPILRFIVDDLQNDVPTSVIARSFHASLADLFVGAAVHARSETGVNRVGLSGGVFQNRLLFDDIRTKLQSQGFEVIMHRRVPTNDGGLAYGQAAVAAQRLSVQRPGC
ncbi:MAG TPA: hypothetical protein VMO47_11995, partial [Rhodothermales bacterium]|nr:hypothetical protein [Rhodothermales bacterium]